MLLGICLKDAGAVVPLLVLWVGAAIPGIAMKRVHSSVASDSEDQGSEHAYEDVVETMISKGCKYGVQWEAFNQVIGIQEAILKACELVEQDGVKAWYIGACKDPHDRFFSEPSPHSRRFHCLHPLLLRKNAGEVEKAVLQGCLEQLLLFPLRDKCANRSGGGEGIHARSLRFVYVCLQWNESSLRAFA